MVARVLLLLRVACVVVPGALAVLAVLDARLERVRRLEEGASVTALARGSRAVLPVGGSAFAAGTDSPDSAGGRGFLMGPTPADSDARDAPLPAEAPEATLLRREGARCAGGGGATGATGAAGEGVGDVDVLSAALSSTICCCCEAELQMWSTTASPVMSPRPSNCALTGDGGCVPDSSGLASMSTVAAAGAAAASFRLCEGVANGRTNTVWSPPSNSLSQS